MSGRNFMGGGEKIRCSFCGRTEGQVRKMISGPSGAFICDECVDICMEIIEEEMMEEDDRGNQSVKTRRNESVSG